MGFSQKIKMSPAMLAAPFLEPFAPFAALLSERERQAFNSPGKVCQKNFRTEGG
jgi:hypothetical protein